MFSFCLYVYILHNLKQLAHLHIVIDFIKNSAINGKSKANRGYWGIGAPSLSIEKVYCTNWLMPMWLMVGTSQIKSSSFALRFSLVF